MNNYNNCMNTFFKKFPNRRFWQFDNSFFFFFLSQFKKLHKKIYLITYIRYSWSNYRNCFSESFYGIYLQVLQKEISIQPPGEPREYHQGEVRPIKFGLHKISYRQNERKGLFIQGHLWLLSWKLISFCWAFVSAEGSFVWNPANL